MKKTIILLSALLIASVFSGCFHQHTWKAASCYNPRTCIACGTTEGIRLEHDWSSATCLASKHCTRCGKKEGVPLGHTWSEGSATTPRICQRCNEMEPLTLPKSGQVFIGSDLYTGSELSIQCSTSESCYIKLKDSSGIDVFSFFVRAGSSVTVPVPAGYYYVYFSYGNEWYGTEHLFGPDTTYAKDDEIVDFENYTCSYTLEPVLQGNFSETPVNENEFK